LVRSTLSPSAKRRSSDARRGKGTYRRRSEARPHHERARGKQPLLRFHAEFGEKDMARIAQRYSSFMRLWRNE
jgi:hypothetical protein